MTSRGTNKKSVSAAYPPVVSSRDRFFFGCPRRVLLHLGKHLPEAPLVAQAHLGNAVLLGEKSTAVAGVGRDSREPLLAAQNFPPQYVETM